VCDEPAVDAARVKSGEVTPTGPMWGTKMRLADREALTFESRSLAEQGVSEAALLAHPAFRTGTRRAVRVVARDVEVEPWTVGARVSFTLPAGSYATVFVGELTGDDVIDNAFDNGPAHTRA
jgi:tRNA pseudouridine13 synthase